MSLVFLFLGCYILYGKSKYFPEHLNKIGKVIKGKKQIATIVGYLFLLLSYILSGIQFGWGTGFVVYLAALSFMYCLLLITLRLNKNYIYIIALISLVLIIIESNI